LCLECRIIADPQPCRTTPGLTKSMIFKGVKGSSSLSILKKDMQLEGAVSTVHMGVIGCCLGVRLQTSQGCYLENRVGEMSSRFRVESRCLDQCNVVRLSVCKWSLPRALIPLSNDIVVTGKGSLVHRFTWDCLVWDEGTEARVLEECEQVAEEIRAMLG